MVYGWGLRGHGSGYMDFIGVMVGGYDLHGLHGRGVAPADLHTGAEDAPSSLPGAVGGVRGYLGAVYDVPEGTTVAGAIA
jgi:hypothetical protein